MKKKPFQVMVMEQVPVPGVLALGNGDGVVDTAISVFPWGDHE